MVDQTTINQGIRHITSNDPLMVKAVARWGIPLPRTIDAIGFAGLVSTVVGQQISTQVAQRIRDRMEEAWGENPDPRKVIECDMTTMRDMGLSQRKAEYIYNIARAVLSGELNFDTLHKVSDDELIAKLITLRGIGLWTAQVYALMCLGRGDIFPALDLGVQKGFVDCYALTFRDKPSPFANAKDSVTKADILTKHAQLWSPYRSVATIFLWHVKNSQSSKKDHSK